MDPFRARVLEQVSQLYHEGVPARDVALKVATFYDEHGDRIAGKTIRSIARGGYDAKTMPVAKFSDHLLFGSYFAFSPVFVQNYRQRFLDEHERQQEHIRRLMRERDSALEEATRRYHDAIAYATDDLMRPDDETLIVTASLALAPETLAKWRTETASTYDMRILEHIGDRDAARATFFERKKLLAGISDTLLANIPRALTHDEYALLEDAFTYLRRRSRRKSR